MFAIVPLVHRIVTFAVDAAPSFDFFSLLSQIGLGGIIAAPFIVVWRKAEDRADAAEERNQMVLDVMVKEFTPTLVRAQDAMKSYDAGLTTAMTALKEMVGHQPDASQMAEIIRLLHRLEPV